MRLYGGAHREPVLRSQALASRAEGERLLGQIVCVRLRHGYVEVMDVLRMNDDWLKQTRRIWILAGIHPPLA